ncbi:uncharacterized protein LOC120343518 [Styela clava]
MNLKLLTILLLVVLLTIDLGDSWGRRRRRRGGRGRGRSVWRRVKKATRKVGKFYKRNRKTIHRVGKWVLRGAAAYDNEDLNSLNQLKNQNLESYQEYLDNLEEAMSEMYPEEDIDQLMEALDNVVDMNDEDRKDLFATANEEMPEFEPIQMPDGFKDELAMRVANLA